MKITHQKHITDDQFLERCRQNQSVFSSFIDLIPSKIYLNPEDHTNWIQYATSGNKKRSQKVNEAAENGHKISRSDDDDNDMDLEDEDGGFYRVNKFDPRIFKTVSEIFKDFQLMEEKVINRNNLDFYKAVKYDLIQNKLKGKKTIKI